MELKKEIECAINDRPQSGQSTQLLQVDDSAMQELDEIGAALDEGIAQLAAAELKFPDSQSISASRACSDHIISFHR